jgi:hypothetical protein
MDTTQSRVAELSGAVMVTKDERGDIKVIQRDDVILRRAVERSDEGDDVWKLTLGDQVFYLQSFGHSWSLIAITPQAEYKRYGSRTERTSLVVKSDVSTRPRDPTLLRTRRVGSFLLHCQEGGSCHIK